MRRPRPLRVLIAGTYDDNYSRNYLIVDLLRRAGCDVQFIHRSLWGDKRHELLNRSKLRLAVAAGRTYLGLFRALIRAPHPDVFFVLYPGHLDIPAVAAAARIRRVPVLFDMFFSLHDTVSDRGLAQDRSVIAWGARLADRVACRWSNLVLADTPEDLEHFAELTRVDKKRFRLLWIGAPESVFRPLPDVEPDPRLVLFYGTFITLQGIETIVRAAKLLENDDIRVRVIGSGQEQPRIEALARDLDMKNLELRPPVPFERLPAEISAATLCLGIFGTSPKAARVVPNKVFQCIAVGRPVLTADTPAIRSAFSGEVAVVPPGDPVALAEAIRVLIADPSRLAELGAAGRDRFERDYSEEVLSRTLSRYLDELVV